MIRKIAIGLISAVACVGALSPAHAAPPANFAVNGNVQSHCSLGTSPGPLTVSTTVPASGKLDPALNGRTFNLSGLFCDAPSNIKVSATTLRRNPPKASVPNGQSQAANFTATATGWASTPATVTTTEVSPLGSATVFNGTPRSQSSAKSGSVTVTVNNFTTVVGPNGNGQKLVDGAYSSTITVSLTPGS
jgi:hypothetical protein